MSSLNYRFRATLFYLALAWGRLLQDKEFMSACSMLSHHPVSVLCCLNSDTPGISKNHPWSVWIRSATTTFRFIELCITPVVSSDRPNNKTFHNVSVLWASENNRCRDVRGIKIAHAFQDLLPEGGVCSPSNGECQTAQAPHPNCPCPSCLSAWEPWVPLQS